MTILILLLPLLVLTSAETYYVTPSSNTPCPEEGVPCFTLSQYANKSLTNDYFASNATLFILSGNHSLDLELSIKNIIAFSIVSNATSHSDTSITCYGSGRFAFESISVVSIKRLPLFGCMNKVTRVETFTVEDCSFDGQGRNGTGLYLVEVSTTDIIRSNFSSNTGKEISCYQTLTCTAGGAILAINSMYGIRITQCIFQNNTVQGGEKGFGGAVYLESSPNTTIINSTLNSNSVTGVQGGVGGAVYAEQSPNFTILNSTLNDNSVTGDLYGGGGAVSAFYSHNITIANSFLDNNSVTGGQLQGAGGAVSAEYSPITIIYSTLNSNSVTGDRDGYGGAVHANFSPNITIVNSTLNNNFVAGDQNDGYGGAVNANLSPNITIVNSILNNNSVKGDQNGGGGAVNAQNSSTITIVNSSLSSNSVAGDEYGWGGAVCTLFSPKISIFNSTLINNSVTGGVAVGGAAFAQQSPNITIVSSTFHNNSVIGYQWVGRGGAVDAQISPNITIVNSFLNNNSAAGDYQGIGGAVDAYSSPNITIVNSTINSNSATGDHDGIGGAVHVTSSPISIINSSLNNNSVTGYQYGGGGAVYGVQKSNIFIFNSTLNSNCVTGDLWIGRGGAVYTESSFNITIVNSSLNNNSVTGNHSEAGGAVYALSSPNITIVDSTLNNNNVTGSEEGLGGAVCTSFSTNVTIVNSTLSNNSVTADQYGNGGAMCFDTNHNITIVNSTINSNTVNGDNGRGGAVYTNSFVAPVFIQGCTFSNNFANKGSVFYLIQVEFKSRDFLTIQENNATATSGGAFYATQSKLHFLDTTTVLENKGGALVAYQSEIVFTGKVNFSHNRAIRGGAIAAIESKLYINGTLTISHNTASVSGGGIYAYQSELNFQNQIMLSGNTAESRGGGIHAISSTIRLTSRSKTTIQGNLAKRGGGICLEISAKIYLLKNEIECSYNEKNQYIHCITNKSEWISFQLDNNTADYGGAVYVADDTTSATCNAIPFNKMATIHNECFIQAPYYNSYLDIIVQNQSSFRINYCNTYFTNNSANKAGDALYGGLLDRCEASPGNIFGTLTNIPYILNITNIKVKDFNSTEIISSDPVRVCFCKDNLPDCSYHPQPVYVRQGERFTVSLVAVDHINNSLANTTIHANILSPEATLGGQSTQHTNGNGHCRELNYSILTPHNSEELHLYADGPCRGSGISMVTLTVNFAPCPIGFKGPQCACDSTIFPEYITNCDIYTETVQRKDNVWFAYVNITNHSSYVLHKYCPFDYCKPQTENISVNLNINNGANELCAFNRSGKLCGSCENGSSVIFGSSSCRPCSNDWLILIIVFAIAGIVLVAFILKVNFVVAEGTFNVLIFYANIIAANRAIFFPGPHDETKILSVFIAWLNLDFGFETCFYDGMDAYAKTWLQLVFPLYVISLVVAIIIISDHSTKFAMLFVGKNPIATLATLILLSYTKLLRTIIAALQFTTLHFIDVDGSSSSQLVWLVDPNIPYFSAKHVPLFITALIIILVGGIFTFILFAWQWLVYCPNRGPLKWIFGNGKVIAFVDAYHNPFNKDHRYWIGLLFLLRVLLYLVSAVNVLGDPSINLLSIGIVVTSMLIFQIIITEWKNSKIYKKKHNTLLDCISLLNLIVLTIATFLVNEVKGDQTVVAYISIGIAFVMFLVIVVYHVKLFILNKLFQKKSQTFFKPLVTHNNPLKNTLSDSDDELIQVSVTEVNALPEPLDTISTTDSIEENNQNENQDESGQELSIAYQKTNVSLTQVAQFNDRPSSANSSTLSGLESLMITSQCEHNQDKPFQHGYNQDKCVQDRPYQEKTIQDKHHHTMPHLLPSREENYQSEDDDENTPLLP